MGFGLKVVSFGVGLIKKSNHKMIKMNEGKFTIAY
jgi:hypothetical protein